MKMIDCLLRSLALATARKAMKRRVTMVKVENTRTVWRASCAGSGLVELVRHRTGLRCLAAAATKAALDGGGRFGWSAGAEATCLRSTLFQCLGSTPMPE